MTKIIILIITVYLLYYAGNIIYDLFLKKDRSKGKDETEEYAFIGLSEQNNWEIQDIGIDDVEHINTPNSFNKKELFPINEEHQDENRELEHWRMKFESEQNIDVFETVPEIEEKPKEQKETAESHSNQEERVENELNKDKVSQKEPPFLKQFNQFLNLAETSVQVLSELEGYKVYHSLM